MLGALPDTTPLIAPARLLGAQIDTRIMAADASAATLVPEAGLTFVFRCGVVVTIGSGGEPTDRLDARPLGRGAGEMPQR